MFDHFPLHAHGQALLVTAVLAAIALAFVNQALFVIPAGIAQVFAYSSFEETFATLTAVHSIVLARRAVSTDDTHAFLRQHYSRTVSWHGPQAKWRFDIL